MGRVQDADWDAVRQDYEEGRGTQVEIAARHGIHPTCLAMRKARGGWVSAADVARWAKRDAAIDALIDTLTARLKSHAATGKRLAAEMKTLEEAARAANGDRAELEARVEACAKAGRDLSATLSMAATVQRMAERRREDNARFAVPTRENPLERADYRAVERAILDRLAAAGLVRCVDGADGGGESAAGEPLGLVPGRGPDAA